jgi:hypothetical protein
MWERAKDLMDTLPIDVYDATEAKHGRTIEHLAKHIEAIADDRQLIIIDYAQRIRSQQYRTADLYALSAEVSDQLSTLATRLDKAILLGSQVTISENGVYTKGGYAWEEDAGLICHIRKPTEREYEKMDSMNQVLVDGYFCLELQRFGPSDLKAEMRWSAEDVKWVEL